MKLGAKEEDNYTNMYDEMVYWEFTGLEGLTELENRITDGVEIRSRLFGHANPETLVYAKDRLSIFSGSLPSEYRIINEDIPADDE